MLSQKFDETLESSRIKLLANWTWEFKELGLNPLYIKTISTPRVVKVFETLRDFSFAKKSDHLKRLINENLNIYKKTKF
jgi:hypothetical protein